MQGTHNGVRKIFVCDLWDEILKTQFWDSKIPTEFSKATVLSFVDEMFECLGPEMDIVALFIRFTNWLKTSQLRNVEKTNWYDVPSILRVVAPSHNTIEKACETCKKFYMSETLKGLPHGIIMLIWKKFQLKDEICGIKSPNQVRFKL